MIGHRCAPFLPLVGCLVAASCAAVAAADPLATDDRADRVDRHPLLALLDEAGASFASGDGPLPGGPSGMDGGGACCLMGDACLPAADEIECGRLGGVFLPGETCDNNPCLPGACCDGDNCGEAGAFSCITAGRTFAGAGTTCFDDPCESGVGACCFGDGGCLDLAPKDCDAMGGTWLGAGTNCGQDPCTFGGCCLPGGGCIDNARYECDDIGGAFVPGVFCADDACDAAGECPNDSLFAQTFDGPQDFVGGTSEASSAFQRWENFSGVAGPIEGLIWWGFDLDNIGGSNFVECEEPDPTFEITFHEDAGGAPGAVVCAYELTAERTPTGDLYLGAELNRYEVALPDPCVLVNGWVSIHGLGDAECWFLWLSAGSGDSWCDNCIPSQQSFDLSLCLLGPTGGVFGACCTEATGGCLDNVEIIDCLAPDQRFVPDAACADLDPPCGVVFGACCLGDDGCNQVTEESCAKQGGDWLGANTLCNACPCAAPCPPDAVQNDEPACMTNYVDAFNPGCNSADPVFSTIEAGVETCGTSGIFELNGEPTPDFDWYEIVVDGFGQLVWTARAEFRPQVWIIDGNNGCPGEVLDTGLAFECDDVDAVADVGPGRYWLVIAPWAFTDSAACGARYTASVFLLGGCTPDLDGDGLINAADLAILLSAWGDNPGAPADLNDDGVVDAADLALLLAEWGECLQ